MVHIFKRKGDRHTCNDHRGIALLSIPGKILARVIASRLTSYVEAHGVLPESQCGFRAGRSTTDITFTVRQIQEKCREQQREMFTVFVDLSKAFDSVHRPGLWAVLRMIGCPPAFVHIIRSLHDGMMAAVVENGECSPEFEVTNSTKQGCVLAPLLFLIFFSVMLRVAFNDCDRGIHVHCRTDGDPLDIRRLQAKTKVSTVPVSDMLFADDYALVAHTQVDIQELFDRFSTSAKRVGLMVSINKTEAVHQSYPPNHPENATVAAGDSHLKSVSKFCYLGSYVTSRTSQDEDITARIAKAGSTFGKLRQKL